MRPTDGHQTPTTRPSFTSATGRPAARSENILARLERKADGAGPRWPVGARRAAVGAAAGAALLALVALLTPTPERLQVHGAAPLVVATPLPLPESAGELSTEGASQADSEAAQQMAAAAAAPTAAMPAIDTLPLEPSPVLPMLADVAATTPAAPLPRKSKPAPLAHAARPGPVQNTLAPAPRRERNGGEPGVDSDVALLSAILIHAPRHSAERARIEANCNIDKKCPLNSGLPALLKAAD